MLSKEEAIKGLEGLRVEPQWAKDDDWNWPNDLAIDNALRIINRGLKVNRISPDCMGGVALYHYGPGEKFAWMSTWNNGEVDSFYMYDWDKSAFTPGNSIRHEELLDLPAEIKFWNVWVQC